MVGQPKPDRLAHSPIRTTREVCPIWVGEEDPPFGGLCWISQAAPGHPNGLYRSL